MPGFDRTGPFGYGQLTGWQRGYCIPRGRGFRRWYSMGRSREMNVRDLEYQRDLLREELRIIKGELDSIKKEPTS